MELIKYIKDNQINNFEILKNKLESDPFNLKIKEDINYPHLLLIYIQDNSNLNLKLVRECNGIILNKDTLNIVCYTFDKCDDTLEFPYHAFNLNDLYIEKAIEGTLVRLFYDKNTNGWLLSTKKCIDASKSKWVSNKTFDQLFNECINFDLIRNNLDINICYSFIICHPENKKIVYYEQPMLFHISSRNLITLQEIDLKIGINQIEKEYIPKESLNNYLQNINYDTNLSYEGYIFIDTNYNRWKIKTPLYSKVKELWGNTNNRFYRYLELRKNNILLNEYLDYFTCDRILFQEYESKISYLINKIIGYYIAKHIEKTDQKIPFYLNKFIYQLHGDYFKNKIKTNFNKVSLLLLNTDIKLICYMINNLEKEEFINKST